MATDGVPRGVGQYDATTGATISAAFIDNQGFAPARLALDGNNHLFTTLNNLNTVSQFDAVTGATVNFAFINSGGLNHPLGWYSTPSTTSSWPTSATTR